MSQRKFSRFVQPIKCLGCGKLKLPAEGAIGPRLCGPCYEEAGEENEHEDGHHDGAPSPGCPMCKAARFAAAVSGKDDPRCAK